MSLWPKDFQVLDLWTNSRCGHCLQLMGLPVFGKSLRRLLGGIPVGYEGFSQQGKSPILFIHAFGPIPAASYFHPACFEQASCVCDCAVFPNSITLFTRLYMYSLFLGKLA
jgi:hypothetical protein